MRSHAVCNGGIGKLLFVFFPVWLKSKICFGVIFFTFGKYPSAVFYNNSSSSPAERICKKKHSYPSLQSVTLTDPRRDGTTLFPFFSPFRVL